MKVSKMDLLVMDKEFKVIAVADYFESIIWVDRYKEAGDFHSLHHQ